MKTRLLIIIIIIVSIYVYFDSAYAQESAIDLDPDLYPSYERYEQQIFSNPNSIFIVVPIQLGIISLILVSTHLILKKKMIILSSLYNFLRFLRVL